MSYLMSDWVWQHSRATGPAHHVLLALAWRADDDGVAWPGMAWIAQRARVGVGTVHRAVAKLVELGELEVTEPSAGTRQNRYRLLRPAYPEDVSSVPEGNAGVPDWNAGPSAAELQPSGVESQCSGVEGQHSGAEPNQSLNDQQTIERPIDRAGGPPASVRPLVDALTRRGIHVMWPDDPAGWERLRALVDRSGTEALARHAVDTAAVQRARGNPVSSATYFERGWARLAPLPDADTPDVDIAPVIPLRAAAGAEIYRDADDDAIYRNGWETP